MRVTQGAPDSQSTLEELQRKLSASQEETKEALEQQTAVSKVLATISRSAFDLDAVLQTIAERAVDLAKSDTAAIYRLDGDDLLLVAQHPQGETPIPERSRSLSAAGPTLSARAVRTLSPHYAADVRLDPSLPQGGKGGTLSRYAVPIQREGQALGAIVVMHYDAVPFTERQRALVATFADQAAIAIENVRLFNETKEALERQTALSEVLRSISGSPTDAQPVLDVVAKNAARFCGAEDAGVLILRAGVLVQAAHHGELGWRQDPLAIDPTSVSGRAVLEGHTLQVADLQAESVEYPRGSAQAVEGGYRATLASPLLREGQTLGVILLRRTESTPFTDKQVDLVRTFADQAAIAIENVRLFTETKEALERQTAISEILRAIAGSPSDERPVLQTIATSAAKYTGAPDAVLFLARDQVMWVVGYSGTVQPTLVPGTELPLDGAIAGRAILERKTIHVADIAGPEGDEFPDTRERAARSGFRALLAAPLVQGERALGALYLRKPEPIPFTSDQIQLVETFANQAVIAIENVRLFNETKEKSRQLETVNQDLAAASKHKSEFLANMSHELRTPLNAVIGFSEVLLQKMFGELNEQQTDYVRDISSSGRHLLDLVNEILDLSKIEAGRMELEPSEFDLANTISGAVMFVRERAGRHGIELASHLPDDLGTVVADERKVRQVLLNLLSNAVKFTPDGGAIGVRARRSDGEVEISVRDTGIGIAPEDQPRVFEEFQQVGKPSDRSREGTGLGLALAKRFVELHGGRMGLDSEVGKGTTFTFAIPTNTHPGTSA